MAGPPATAAARDQADRWVTRSWDITHPWGSGHVFPNFADPGLVPAPERYYAGNLPRLTRVKLRYDPGDVFRHPQSVPLP